MGYTLKTNIANKKNYGSSRKTSKIKYIVIHYTANDGDTDESNAKYFKNNIVKASAHYFVDDDSITQSVHDNYIAWHCGGSRYSNYKQTGGAKYYNKCTNTNSLGIELCDTKKDGKYGFTDKTINNAVEIVKDKMKQYNVPIDRVIRHFDVTGKICPKPFVDDDKQWRCFKDMLIANNSSSNKSSTKTASTTNYYPKCESKYSSIVDALNSIKVISSYANRKKIAKANGITLYIGSASQNTKLLKLLKQGKLKKA